MEKENSDNVFHSAHDPLQLQVLRRKFHTEVLHTVPKFIDFNIVAPISSVESGECTSWASPDDDYLLLISVISHFGNLAKV